MRKITSRHLQSSSPDRNFILHGSKALQLPVQGPHEGSQAFYPAGFQCILPGRNFILHGSAAAAGSPVCSRACGSRRGFSIINSILIIPNRISTCNIHSSTKVSGLGIYYLFYFCTIIRIIILILEELSPSGQNQCF